MKVMFTSPYFRVDNGRGLGLFLDFLVCHWKNGSGTSMFKENVPAREQQ